MSKAADDLDNEFGIFEEAEEPLEIEVVKEEPMSLKNVKDTSSDRSKDYNYSRAQLYDIVEKMQESINDAMDVAHESQHPRAYEVVFQGAKAAADVVDKIADLHKKMKDLEVEEVKVQQHNTTNNVFMQGSTQDIIKALKDASKENKDKG